MNKKLLCFRTRYSAVMLIYVIYCLLTVIKSRWDKVMEKEKFLSGPEKCVGRELRTFANTGRFFTQFCVELTSVTKE